MLGISAQLKYKYLNDFKSSYDYIAYMYHDIKGLFAIGQLNNSNYLQVMKRENGIKKEKFENKINTFISMNSFFKNERKVKTVKRLNACYVDLDYYKLNLTKESVLYMLEQDFYGTEIPVPTFVIDSGNGLYLIWKLRNEDRNALPKWNKVQEYLIDKLKELGADTSCRDAARILRIPYTVNAKNGKQVQIIDFNDATYSLYDIINEFDIKTHSPNTYDKKKKYPYGQATQKMRDFCNEIKKIKDVALPNFSNFNSTQKFIEKNKGIYEEKNFGQKKVKASKKDILRKKCRDIEVLFAMRKGEDCKRELGLFIYRHWLYAISEDEDYALEKTLELNAMLDCSFSSEYVIKRTASAIKKIKNGSYYNYSIKKIISTLDITEEEMSQLNYLKNKTPEKRKSKKQEINKKYYINQLIKHGKTAKKTKIQERQHQIENMLEQGKKRKEICQILQISKATYQRDIITIKANQEKLKEEIKETKAIIKPQKIINSNAFVENIKNWTVSFFKTLYYKISSATARLSFSYDTS